MLATILEPIFVFLGSCQPRDTPEIIQIFPLVSKKVYRYPVDDQGLEDFCLKSKQLGLSKTVATQMRSYLMTIISQQ